MKILVAYDGSVCGDGALYDLAGAGLPAAAEALVLTVTPPYPPFSASSEPGAAGWTVLALERARELAAEALSAARETSERGRRYLMGRFPGWSIKAEILSDQPAQGILSKADKWKPDLIVLGSHGRSSLGRLLLGSVSQKVLLHSAFPVRISRAHIGADPAAPRVLVAFDGSACAMAALDAVASREWPARTEISLLAVVDSREALEGILEGASPDLEFAEGKGARTSRNAEIPPQEPGRPRTWIGRKLETACNKLVARGFAVTPQIRLGEPRHVILQEAKDWGAHCVFLGSRGLNTYQRFLLGSVSSAVAFHAPCTVEVVRMIKPPRKRKSGGRTLKLRVEVGKILKGRKAPAAKAPGRVGGLRRPGTRPRFKAK
jgi:nucleotide-binding universal stress UspA family protein